MYSLSASPAMPSAASAASALRLSSRVDGSAYIVKARDGSRLKLMPPPNAGVAASVKSALSDIKSGSYIAVAALPQGDGTLRALEVHVFHESIRGTGDGHRPWDLQPKSTMTNATVYDVVSAVDGHDAMLKYKGGEQRIVIPAGTVIVTYLPGSITEFAPGAVIFVPVARRQADGTLLAQRMMVGREIARPQLSAGLAPGSRSRMILGLWGQSSEGLSFAIGRRAQFSPRPQMDRLLEG